MNNFVKTFGRSCILEGGSSLVDHDFMMIKDILFKTNCGTFILTDIYNNQKYIVNSLSDNKITTLILCSTGVKKKEIYSLISLMDSFYYSPSKILIIDNSYSFKDECFGRDIGIFTIDIGFNVYNKENKFLFNMKDNDT